MVSGKFPQTLGHADSDTQTTIVCWSKSRKPIFIISAFQTHMKVQDYCMKVQIIKKSPEDETISISFVYKQAGLDSFVSLGRSRSPPVLESLFMLYCKLAPPISTHQSNLLSAPAIIIMPLFISHTRPPGCNNSDSRLITSRSPSRVLLFA